jgi:small ligand-binding sensory domain FIST
VAVFGAGTAPAGAVVVAESGRVSRGGVVGLALVGLARPSLRSSPACRLLAPLAPITEARGAMVLRIGDEPALDALAAAAKGLAEQPLVLAVLAKDEARPGRGGLVVRGVRGVDPVKRAVVVSDEATVGMQMGFAVRDAGAARADLESALRDVHREIAGAAPRFGVLVTCAGRGAGLYGTNDVEPRMLRARFPDVPFAGMFSSFEIGPSDGRTTMHLYTAVTALFAAPS